MGKTTVSIRGLSEAKLKVGGLPTKLERGSAAAVADVVEETTTSAKRNAPVDTRALQNSIKGEVSGTTGTVTTGVDYAPYVEYGTSRSPAQPFMRPAAEEARNRFKRIATNEVRKAAR